MVVNSFDSPNFDLNTLNTSFQGLNFKRPDNPQTVPSFSVNHPIFHGEQGNDWFFYIGRQYSNDQPSTSGIWFIDYVKKKFNLVDKNNTLELAEEFDFKQIGEMSVELPASDFLTLKIDGTWTGKIDKERSDKIEIILENPNGRPVIVKVEKSQSDVGKLNYITFIYSRTRRYDIEPMSFATFENNDEELRIMLSKDYR